MTKDYEERNVEINDHTDVKGLPLETQTHTNLSPRVRVLLSH